MSLIKINNIIDIENNIFKFNDKNITITYDEYNNVWFKGKDVCDILEYKKSENAIKRHVENEDKIEYKKLNFNPPPLFQGGVQYDRTLQNRLKQKINNLKFFISARVLKDPRL